MKNTFATKAATFLLSLVFILIIVSFLFGNYDNFSSASPQDVATVEGLPISPREYQMRLSQQVEFFNQMMGGNITPQQIQQMGIKETVLGQLIQGKLLLSYGLKNGLSLSESELKEDIKKLPYFQREGKFDVVLYRNLLASNQYTPTQFEEMIGFDVASRKMEQMISAQKASEGMARDILRFKMNAVKTEAVRVERQNLISLIDVTPAEAKEFADKAENNKLLTDMYQENFAKYNKPEEVKARHILLKVENASKDAEVKAKIQKIATELTTKNFAEKAKALTEDPSGKSNGGDLGWFSKGRMVPEFEKAAFESSIGSIVGPIKTSFGYHMLFIEGKKGEEKKSFDQVKVELSTMAIQKRKSLDLDKLMTDTKSHLEAALKSNDQKAITADKAKMNLVHFPGTEVNQYDLSVGPNSLTADEGKRLFAAKAGDILDFSTPGALFLVKVGDKVNADVEAKISEMIKTEIQTQSQLLSRKFREEMLKELNTNAKVVTNPALL
ncbi:MAG: SurA N-terminal domain-containing protein [Bacteriovoracaceae bacterium]|nr:SurA N-terminal domain-containing protein [Bacteriovoracaceae bacterium]